MSFCPPYKQKLGKFARSFSGEESTLKHKDKVGKAIAFFQEISRYVLLPTLQPEIR